MKQAIKGVFGRKPMEADVAQVVEFRGARIICTPANKLENKLLENAAAYDRPNFNALISLVKEGDICFDIGANIGIYSSVLSRAVGSAGHVHSFEPVRHIRRKLYANLAMNGAKNVTVNHFALGAEAGELPMFQVKEGEFRGGTSTFVRNNNVEKMGEQAFEKEIVKIAALDSYVEEMGIDRVDFMKIDVEGFELNVLKGAVKTLGKFRPPILFEHNQGRLGGLEIKEEDFALLFSELGYSCFETGTLDERLSLVPFGFDRKMRGNNLMALHIPA